MFAKLEAFQRNIGVGAAFLSIVDFKHVGEIPVLLLSKVVL